MSFGIVVFAFSIVESTRFALLGNVSILYAFIWL